jgi:predicted Zn finger-like uncharacterized protein
MPMQVECPSCRATIQVPEAHAGKRGRCPRCKAVFSAPVLETAPVESGLVSEPAPAADAVVAPSVQLRQHAVGSNDGDVYALADASTKKAKAVRVREGALPGMGIGAKEVLEAAAPTRRTMTPKQVLAAFEGEIEPVRPTILYRLWVAIVAGVMVLLPVLYVAIIGLVTAGLVYHAVHNVTIFQAVGHRANALKAAALIYISPLLAGAVVIALMLKPLFARPARGPRQRTLDPGAEPLLYAFVDGVCAAVGAPRPARIAVDCRVNASAHREGGILGILGGELVLTIGLPFVAGVTLKQFAGVLAHEFGHFAQGAGMRLYALIMRINLWFARVVYQRDEWDETIASWSSGEQGALMILGAIVRLAVWLTRRILWVLMQVGHVVSGFLSRQMEYDADRYEARMVGGAVFAETMWRFRVMSVAENGAFADLQSSWQQRRLPDNFPKLVTANIPQIPEPLIAAFRQSMETTRTGLFDTHPADKDRIARALREAPGPGIFHVEGPATNVFRNFDALAKTSSLDMYKSALGPGITQDQLYEVSELVETQTAAQEGAAAAARFFLGAWNPARRLPMPAQVPQTPADLAAAKRALVQVRDELQAARGGYLEAAGRTDEIRNRLYLADMALIFLKTGVPVKPADFELKAATPKVAESARDRAEAELRQVDAACERFATAAAGRLIQVLALLEAEPVVARVAEGPARRDEARALYRCAAHLAAEVAPQLARLAHASSLLLGAVQAYQAGKDPKNEPLINAMLRAAAGLRDRLEESRWKVGDAIDYPFEHADENVTLAKFAFPPRLPEKDDIGGLLEASGEALDRVSGLYHRALGRLAVTAEEVERALGLPPIPVDAPDERP